MALATRAANIPQMGAKGTEEERFDANFANLREGEWRKGGRTGHFFMASGGQPIV